MLEIDIKTKLVPPDHRVFVLHPGEKKGFYGSFADQSVVFLDFPGAILPKVPDVSQPEVRAEIYKARAIASWYRSGADAKKQPSREASDYLNSARRKNTARYLNEIQALFVEAKPGDLVIVPGPGYSTTVFIGEFVDNYRPGDFGRAAHLYGPEKIPARRVRWFPDTQIKRKFSERLITLMQNRQALIEIKANEEREEIYDLVYKDYAWGGEAVGRTKVTSQTVDLRNFTGGTKILYYFAALYLAEDDGKLDQFSPLDVDEAIRRFYVEGTFSDTGIAINSPGTIWLHTKKITLPAFLSVMLALTGEQASAADVRNVHVVNTAALPGAVDPCAIDVQKRVHAAVNASGSGLWEKMCRERTAEKRRLGLESITAPKRSGGHGKQKS